MVKSIVVKNNLNTKRMDVLDLEINGSRGKNRRLTMMYCDELVLY